MGITMTTTETQIKAYIQSQMERTEKAIIRTLQYVGEQCVISARQFGSYRDNTGNLRNSTGYVIVKNGNIINNQIDTSTKGGRESKKMVEELAPQYTCGIALIVVAGMEYAATVAAKGYNVLDSAELTAQALLPKLLQQLKDKSK